jgi:RNA polymerase sigma-70 factor, ECF subfamily
VNAEDTKLVQQSQSGDRLAFGRLVEQHWPRLVRFALSVVGDLDAEDCVQEAFLIAWHKLPGLTYPEALPSWLLRITARLCFRRSRYRRFLEPLSSLLAEPVSSKREPSSDIDVEWILMRLAPRQRAVMHLTIMEGMTDSEIAMALHITPASVRSHRRRAREALLKWVPHPTLPNGEIYDPERNELQRKTI